VNRTSFPRYLVRHLIRHQGTSPPFLASLVSDRLLERLQWVKLTPQRILDLGAGPHSTQESLQQRFPDADMIMLDLDAALLPNNPQESGFWSRWRQRPRQFSVVAQAPYLPFKSGSFSLIWANLLLPWIDPANVFAEVARLLAPGGMFLFSGYGPDTLRELRQAMTVLPHGKQRLAMFPDLHDLGDELVHARLADPVMEREDLCIHYPDLTLLWHDLRALGPAPLPRPSGLLGRQSWQRMHQHYDQYREPQGLPVTLEVIIGQAWKPLPRTLPDGRSVIDIRTAH
jgi:Methylase involved in ubiquinone/menaquinone biosynthesis